MLLLVISKSVSLGMTGLEHHLINIWRAEGGDLASLLHMFIKHTYKSMTVRDTDNQKYIK